MHSHGVGFSNISAARSLSQKRAGGNWQPPSDLNSTELKSSFRSSSDRRITASAVASSRIRSCGVCQIWFDTAEARIPAAARTAGEFCTARFNWPHSVFSGDQFGEVCDFFFQFPFTFARSRIWSVVRASNRECVSLGLCLYVGRLVTVKPFWAYDVSSRLPQGLVWHCYSADSDCGSDCWWVFELRTSIGRVLFFPAINLVKRAIFSFNSLSILIGAEYSLWCERQIENAFLSGCVFTLLLSSRFKLLTWARGCRRVSSFFFLPRILCFS